MTENARPPIVVGIDGSTPSLAALRWALRQGAQSDTPVHVVHCWQPQSLTEYALVAPHSFARASVCMLDNEIADALAEMEPKPVVQPISIHGRPATALLTVADGAAMLVLGSHARTDLQDLVFGHVIRTCEKHAACTVVVVNAEGCAVQQNNRMTAGAGR
jgi:nucleotide-binding universal stress UspA family protein